VTSHLKLSRKYNVTLAGYLRTHASLPDPQHRFRPATFARSGDQQGLMRSPCPRLVCILTSAP